MHNVATSSRPASQSHALPSHVSAFPAKTARTLAAELERAIEGEVRFDRGSRALYANDSSNYRQTPIGVVIPRHNEDVIKAVEICHKHGAPVLSRGGGTSLAGQCCNVAVVLDFSKYMNKVIEVDPERKIARVQPGCILDDLRDEAEKHHLTFGPDPSTHAWCTLGGMIGNNSCGVHSIMSGRTSDNVVELDVLTYDGTRMRIGQADDDEFQRITSEGGRKAEIYRQLRDLRDEYADEIRERYPDIPRRVSGYNLDDLLPENDFQVARSVVGSEGTLVVVLEATVQLIPSPPERSLLVLGYDDVFGAGDDVPEIMSYGPVGLEGFDDNLINYMLRKHMHPRERKLLPQGSGWLMVEFGGDTKQESDAAAKRLMDDLKKRDSPPSMKLFDDPKDEAHLWEVRESGLAATAHVPGEHEAHPGWEDAAAPPERLGDYLRDFRDLLNEYGYDCSLYGHFGQGCIHVRIDFDLRTHEGIEHYLAFIDEASDLVVSYGGSFSAEHGDGQAKASLLPKMFGDEIMEAFRTFKSIWDPDWKMNPGKVVEPYEPDQNLRLGVDFDPPSFDARLDYEPERGTFPWASLRCVGVGKCRRVDDEGVMCPSFKATREESDTTRGRARMLWEMVNGEVVTDGWRSREVYDSLDLCLGCKGCKHDCPVNVDMATYKSEFLSHYYEGRVRPRIDYAMGLIGYTGRLASRVPRLANFATQTPGLRYLAKRAAGVHPQRSLPEFAHETFTAWFERQPNQNPYGERVILWPDAFNDLFFPDILKAATEVLQRLGYQVVLPASTVPAVRPLMHYGMLDRAKREMRSIIRDNNEDIRGGTRFIVLEPSTASVFRDDLSRLMPHDEDARRLEVQTATLGEFLVHREHELPAFGRKAILHGHCHDKSVLDFEAERTVLRRMGVEFREPESGCCGMAGSFGYEADHYDISMKIGELALLPAVRNADPETLVIASGFSCREQILQSSGREPVHLAQVLRQAMRAADSSQQPDRQREESQNTKAKRAAVAVGAMAAAVGTSAVVWKQRKES